MQYWIKLSVENWSTIEKVYKDYRKNTVILHLSIKGLSKKNGACICTIENAEGLENGSTNNTIEYQWINPPPKKTKQKETGLP